MGVFPWVGCTPAGAVAWRQHERVPPARCGGSAALLCVGDDGDGARASSWARARANLEARRRARNMFPPRTAAPARAQADRSSLPPLHEVRGRGTAWLADA